MTLDDQAVTAVGAAAYDLRELVPQLARGHGGGVSEVFVGDALGKVMGHGVVSGELCTHSELSPHRTRFDMPRAT